MLRRAPYTRSAFPVPASLCGACPAHHFRQRALGRTVHRPKGKPFRMQVDRARPFSLQRPATGRQLLANLQKLPEDYPAAARRHWRDAELLWSHQRQENADQLYGIAAECAVKAALSSLPGYSAQACLHDKYKLHIDKLWDQVHVHNMQKRFPGVSALLGLDPPPFGDWTIAQRYAADACLARDAVEAHRKAARRLLGAALISEERTR
ncbi:MAG TPA: hypothetical protein PKA30_14920 [Accumulibacter sp.]|uniref:hypothetical protein n=1 Tax=Accumulibacter sp. TaxID=2053492 RepID=UPI002C77D51F|nr:hypothetical protein [Accumulibacter sp.]HMV06827.1 hypothetical protein [Accumulibacter sp.]HMW65244.1 hypothetical protein [Accumulibacter sp.]HMW81929.1 hypothetical protein [Accumulibacter sp.]HMX69302.1 hypothetical protein [Accumulibacter sp.]HNB69412.1 hypothetical protein [Accumulibacter sp.]